MGSNFSRQICCVVCGRCKEEEVEDAHEETSESKPILQTSGKTSMYIATQPSLPAREVSKQGSEEVQSLRQDQWPSADAAEENRDTCSAADFFGVVEGWVMAWDSLDFLVDPADGETKGEVEVLNQADNQQERAQVGKAREKRKAVPCGPKAQPVTHTAEDAKLVAVGEQCDEQSEAGSEGSLCATLTLQETYVLNFIDITSETAAGQDPEIKPHGESLIRRNLPLCSVERGEETATSAEHGEETDKAMLAEISPPSANPLYPEGESLKPVSQLLDLLEQETQSRAPTAQEVENLHCAHPVEWSEALSQSSYGVLVELEDEESRECDAETEGSAAQPQPRTMQQTTELPEEPITCGQLNVKQEADFLDVMPLLSEVLESSGEIEAENVHA